MALYNEVRPHSFTEMVGQTNIVKNISAQSKADAFFQTYIFSGQYGTGKTTMARILAMAINCSHKAEDGSPCCECETCKAILENRSIDVVEVDGASNTGVDKIREIISDVSYEPVFLKKKVYIIDEVHMLSTSAFNALLKTLEEPAPTVTFVLCTTELRKIPDTVISRSACYVFERIDRDLITGHLKKTCEDRNIPFTDDGIALIARRCDGSMRNALSVLEQVATTGEVNADNVANLLLIPDSNEVVRLLSIIASGESNEIVNLQSISTGMVDDMINVLSDAMLNKMGALSDSGKYVESLDALSSVPSSTLIDLSDTLVHIKDMLRQGYGKNVVLLELVKFNSRSVSLLKRVEELEGQIAVLKEELKKGVMVAVPSDTPAMPSEENSVDTNVSADIPEDFYFSENEEVDYPPIEPWEPVGEEEGMATDGTDGEPEEPVEEPKPSEDFSFGGFSFFGDMFPSISTAPSVSVASDAEVELARVSSENAAFREALNGCTKEVSNGVIVLATPLEPIYDIIKCCLEVYNIHGVDVVLDNNLLL